MPSAGQLVLGCALAFSFAWDPGFLELLTLHRSHSERPYWKEKALDPEGGRRTERFSLFSWFGMPAFAKWSRIYKKVSHNTGRQLLLICRLRPKKKGDTKWVAVGPNRTLETVDVKDRQRYSTRRLPNIVYENFPTLSREERQDAEDKARELQRKAESTLPHAMKMLSDYLKSARTAVAAAWAARLWGTSGAVSFFAWRLAVYCEAWGWLRWFIERVEDAHDTVLEIQDLKGYLLDLHADGKMELPLLVLSLVVMLGSLCYSCCWQSGSSVRHLLAESPPGSDVDSDGEPGHDAQHTSDEEDKNTDELKATLRALVAEVSRLKAEAPDAASGSSSGPSSARGEPRTQELPFNASMEADRVIARLSEFERALTADRKTSSVAAAPSSSPPSLPKLTPEPPQAASGSPSSSSWVDLSPLKESLRDPREKLMSHAELLAADVQWKLPGNLKERVAPALIVQVVSRYGSFSNFAESWVNEKELHRNHTANEMFMLAMVLDKLITTTPEILKSESCEILARRVYALRRAFHDVKGLDDWKQPKGTKASQWKSKVRWDLAQEIDWRSLVENEEVLPGVERDLQMTLQNKALVQKYLAQPLDGPKSAMEDG